MILTVNFILTFLILQFAGNLFDLLDSDEDGEIDINDFISSLDRLEWYKYSYFFSKRNDWLFCS